MPNVLLEHSFKTQNYFKRKNCDKHLKEIIHLCGKFYFPQFFISLDLNLNFGKR